MTSRELWLSVAVVAFAAWLAFTASPNTIALVIACVAVAGWVLGFVRHVWR